MSSPLPDGRVPPLPLELTGDRDITRMIVVDAGGGTSASYVAGSTEQLTVEAVSVDLAVGSVTENLAVTLTVTDQAGNVIAVAQTDANIATGHTSQVTFGAGLPDTRQFNNDYSDTNAQTGMPPVALENGSTLTVDLAGNPATITELRLWVEDLQLQQGRSEPLPPLLAHRPLSAG